ncbi:hypothetical protein Gotur_007396 [Gossypium turneri]
MNQKPFQNDIYFIHNLLKGNLALKFAIRFELYWVKGGWLDVLSIEVAWFKIHRLDDWLAIWLPPTIPLQVLILWPGLPHLVQLACCPVFLNFGLLFRLTASNCMQETTYLHGSPDKSHFLHKQEELRRSTTCLLPNPQSTSYFSFPAYIGHIL